MHALKREGSGARRTQQLYLWSRGRRIVQAAWRLAVRQADVKGKTFADLGDADPVMAMTMDTGRIAIVMRRRVLAGQGNCFGLADIVDTDEGIDGGDQDGEGQEPRQKNGAPSPQCAQLGHAAP